VSGRIVQLSRSSGGVPKLPVDEVTIGLLGLEGDTHKHTKIHGGPDRAVCVYALEVIQALQAEGQPDHAGLGRRERHGERPGLDGGRPRARLELGDAVVLEVTRYTEPCKVITASFAGGVFRRIDHDRHPGWSRVYTKVVREGVVRVGQPVRIAQ